MNYWQRPDPVWGVRLQNGLTLGNAVKNPKSNLARVVRYLMLNGPSTKLEICENALTFKVSSGMEIRGWNSYLFRAMGRAGFIVGKRVGRKHIYSLGPRAPLVTLK